MSMPHLDYFIAPMHLQTHLIIIWRHGSASILGTTLTDIRAPNTNVLGRLSLRTREKVEIFIDNLLVILRLYLILALYIFQSHVQTILCAETVWDPRTLANTLLGQPEYHQECELPRPCRITIIDGRGERKGGEGGIMYWLLYIIPPPPPPSPPPSTEYLTRSS